jgi:COP9 signalosome complex subunit 5
MQKAGDSLKKPTVNTTGNAANAATVMADARYTFDEGKLQKLKDEAPWMKSPKYFKSVAFSPSAVVKIMMHCESGVEKGINAGNGKPVEVMGMLLGRPDPTTPETLVVTDAFPLPIEGFETRVVADDETVVNFMIALGESLEITRKERFMGWYHSHPFDYNPSNSHCFLSQTDLSTQLQWQRAEDPHGNPFVAIVIDPLRSTVLQNPELKAFRAFPPEYNSPVANECPDGSIEVSEQQRLELWGSCWNRYYELVRCSILKINSQLGRKTVKDQAKLLRCNPPFFTSV